MFHRLSTLLILALLASGAALADPQETDPADGAAASETPAPDAAAPDAAPADEAPAKKPDSDNRRGEVSPDEEESSPDATTSTAPEAAPAPAATSEAPAPAPVEPPAPVEQAAPDSTPDAPADLQPPTDAKDGQPAEATKPGDNKSANNKPGDKKSGDKKSGDKASTDDANAAANGMIGVGAAKWVFRGTSLTMRNSFAPVGLLRNAELTWNPTAATTLMFSPSVWIGDHIALGAYLDITREWTDNDLSTFQGEWQMSDLWLTSSALNFWTVPFLGINMTASANVRLPTSKISWGNTMLTAVGGNFTVNRPFMIPVLGALIFGASAGGTKFFHRYTTGENSSSLEEGGCFTAQYCGIFASNGVRNTDFSLQGRGFTLLSVAPWLGFFADARLIYNQLYPIQQKDPRVTFDPTNPTGQLAPVTGRYFTWTRMSVFSTPHPAVTFFLSASTFHPQLAPNGSYRMPFINRWTQVNFDVQLNAGGIASLFFD